MSWIFCAALWAAAYASLRRAARLRADEAALGTVELFEIQAQAQKPR